MKVKATKPKNEKAAPKASYRDILTAGVSSVCQMSRGSRGKNQNPHTEGSKQYSSYASIEATADTSSASSPLQDQKKNKNNPSSSSRKDIYDFNLMSRQSVVPSIFKKHVLWGPRASTLTPQPQGKIPNIGRTLYMSFSLNSAQNNIFSLRHLGRIISATVSHRPCRCNIRIVTHN